MSGKSEAGSARTVPASAAATVVMLALLLAMVALRLHLALRLNINWDEFHALAILHDFLRGSPISARQTFHVHLFTWLATFWPADEVSQIVAARLAILGFGLLTSALIFVIGRRFLATAGALFAVLCYNTLYEVLVHGASFRPDPLATFLLLAAAAALLGRRAATGTAVAAGAMLALSFMLTPKVVFFAPGLAILALTPAAGPATWRRRLVRLAVLAASGLAFLALLSAFHQALVSEVATVSRSVALKSIAAKVLWTGYWFPGRHYISRSLEDNALVWLLLAGGLALAVRALGRPGERGRVALPLVALALPLATLVFYRNAFPYFFTYILAGAVLLCGLAWERLRRLEGGGGRLGRVLAVALVAGVFVSGVANYLRQLPKGLVRQRQVITTVHRMFPEPVPYIDRCSMISTFPKVGFFMSSWGMDSYQRDQRTVLADAVREHAPPFLIANTPALNLFMSERQAERFRYRLIAEDRRILRQSYIHHWAEIFVAGKHLEVAGGETETEIHIPGTYTLESAIEARIDGRLLGPGDTIDLAKGVHLVETETAGILTLRWGDHLYRPAGPPAREPIFADL